MTVRSFTAMLRLAVAALLFWQQGAHAQATGSLLGQITDPSGGIVPNAAITVISEETGVARGAVASPEDGFYRVPLLGPGAYRITVSAQGFREAVRTGVVVNVERSTRVDIRLEVGTADGASVTVGSEPPLVETAQASQGIVIDNRKIVELPLNGRNFAQLGTLMPGVVAPPSALGGAEGDATPGGFGGATTGFAVNGQRNQSNNFLLDGAANNDTFNSGFVLRPPPDAIQEFKILTHNYGAEYGRNAGSVVNAVTKSGTNAWHGDGWHFNRNNALAARNFFSLGKPALNQNQFGGAAGGPVIKNKWFAFGYYEGFRNTEGATSNRVVLTEAERRGDFSQSGKIIKDPRTGLAFPGNVIPPDRLDAVAQRLLEEFVPLPNTGANQFIRSPSLEDDRDQFGARSDLNLGGRNTLFVRYLFSDMRARNPLGGSNFSPAGESFESRLQDLLASDTHVFSARLIHVARFSVNRIFAKPQTTSGLPASRYGFQVENTQPAAVGLPFVSLSGFFTLGDAQQPFAERVNNVLHIADDWSYMTGRHFLKFGGQLLRENIRVAFLNRPNGDFTFNGAYTGSPAADFLLGLPIQFRQSGGDPIKDGAGYLPGFYLQDDFRLFPRLTLNLGVRYELPVPFKDAKDRVNGWLPGVKSIVYPEAPAGLVYPGDPGVGRGIIEMDANNIAPRLGFAWDLFGNGKSSLRGGWGMFYDSIPQQGDIFQNILAPPFNPLTQFDYKTGEIEPHFANPFIGGRGGLVKQGFSIPVLFIGWDLTREFKTPVTHHFNATMQQQVYRDMVFEAGYVGARGFHQTGFLEANPGVYVPGQTKRGPRVYPEFSLVRPTASVFKNWYDSLQLSLLRRPGKGLSFLLAYTLSKAVDHVSGLNLGNPPRPQDGVTIDDIKGPAQYDARHRFVASYTWSLPRLAGRNPALRSLLGNWQFNGIFQAQTGYPYTATEPVDVGLRYQSNRPNQICDPNDNAPHTVGEWFRTACFERNTLPEDAGKFGTAPRNSIRGPGLLNFDLGLFKAFPIGEYHRLQFRFEGYNVFNKTNFEDIVTNIGAKNFGAVTSARPARVLQLGVKYQF